jgi:hypothetical protein
MKLLGKLHARFTRLSEPKKYRISDVHLSEKSERNELLSAVCQSVVPGHLNATRHVVTPREK